MSKWKWYDITIKSNSKRITAEIHGDNKKDALERHAKIFPNEKILKIKEHE